MHHALLYRTVSVAVWCSGTALVTINVVILHRARLVLGRVTFTSSNRVRTLSVFNQPPRPTQPGHPSGVGKMSTGVPALLLLYFIVHILSVNK